MPIFNAHPRDRLQVIMDGQNLYATLRALDLKINYKRFIATLKEETRLIRVNYFTMLRSQTDAPQLRSVLDMMSFNGYDVTTREAREYIDGGGYARYKGSMIPDMTVAMINAADANTDHIVLFTGDGDMTAAIEACKQRDVRVTLVSSEHTDVMSEDIRRACDQFIDLETLPEDIIMNADEPFPMDD